MSPLVVLIACLACAGCDQLFGLTEVELDHDATYADGNLVLHPFGVPRPLSEINTSANEEDPSLTEDLLELVFVSSRVGTLGLDDLWVSTRANLSSPWNSPTNITALSSPATELHPAISPDGMTIYFSSDRAGGPGLNDIYISQRASRQSPWSVPVLVLELSSAANDLSAAPDIAGLTLVLSSDRNGGTGTDLYISTRAAPDQPWSSPVLNNSLSSPMDDQDAVFAAGARSLYFARGVFGSRDVWLATRASATDADWIAGTVAEVNTAASELDPWVTEDEQLMILNSNRGGTEDLYETRRLP